MNGHCKNIYYILQYDVNYLSKSAYSLNRNILLLATVTERLNKKD